MALTDKLTDIADAIRAKTGESGTMTLTEMATAIGNITTGGSSTIPDSLFVITGVGDYLFANDRWTYLIENYPTKWSINLTSAQNLAYYKTSNFPNNFPAINVNNGSLSYAFQNSKIETPPIINGTGITQFASVFNNSKIETIPQDWFSHIEFQDNAYSMMLNGMFTGNLKIKGIINLQTHKTNNFYTITGNSFYGFPLERLGNNGCSMSGLINIPVFSTTNASMSSKTVSCSYCYWLRQLKFSTNNGTPFVACLKNLTFDFTSGVGYFNFASYILNNDGSLKSIGSELHTHYWDLTDAEIKDLQIYDATSYERLKNNPDAYSTKVEYSLYNKTSALETISTLPDVSAYGTCIIKFKGDAGSLTDGGAINTMTSAEIAVATAKGWTVSFV